MAFSPTVNQAPATGADVWNIFITALLAAGWTLPQFSDGQQIYNSGTPTVAQLKNQYCWFRLRSPADPNTGQFREMVVQSNNTGSPYYAWEYKYSAAAGFDYTELLGTVQTTNGSTTINFSVWQTINTSQGLVFANQPGVVYYLATNINNALTATLSTSFTGTTDNFNTVSPLQPLVYSNSVTAVTASVNNGLTGFTLSANVTLPAGAAIVIGITPNVTYYLAAPIVNGTTGNFTVPFAGTTSTANSVKTNAPTAIDTPVAEDEVSWPQNFNTTGILGFESHTGNFSFLWPFDDTYKMHMMVGDIASNYSWYFIFVTNSSTTIDIGMGMDILNPWVGAADPDPCVLIVDQSGNAWAHTSLNAGNTALSHNPGAASIVGTPYGGYAGFQSRSFVQTNIVLPMFRSLPANSWSGNNPSAVPLWFNYYQGQRTFSAVGVRGWSQLMIADLADTSRTNMDLVQITNPGDHIWVNGSLLPWPTGVAVVS
jgi:hypothetical protein